MEETVGLGSEGHKQSARARFEQSLEEMKLLMADARSIELRLRIHYEVVEHSDVMRTADFYKFVASRFKVEKTKFDKILKALSPDDRHGEFQAVRLISEPLAHGDYVKARQAIDKFNDEYGLKTSLRADPYPERMIENTRNNKGDPVSYAYLIEPGQDNLIMEEFKVFQHQGFADAAREAFDRVRAHFDQEVDLGWSYELLSIGRTFKRGVETPNAGKWGDD